MSTSTSVVGRPAGPPTNRCYGGFGARPRGPHSRGWLIAWGCRKLGFASNQAVSVKSGYFESTSRLALVQASSIRYSRARET